MTEREFALASSLDFWTKQKGRQVFYLNVGDLHLEICEWPKSEGEWSWRVKQRNSDAVLSQCDSNLKSLEAAHSELFEWLSDEVE